jgi:HSP20 family protein
MPAIDIYEGKDKYVVSVDLPGVEPADVDISVEDATLTIRGERKFSQEVDEESFHRVERRYGVFSRSLALPQTVNADAIEASFDRGVLTVEIPKAEEAKPKKISIKATG